MNKAQHTVQNLRMRLKILRAYKLVFLVTEKGEL